jgi:hypothetical protein
VTRKTIRSWHGRGEAAGPRRGKQAAARETPEMMGSPVVFKRQAWRAGVFVVSERSWRRPAAGEAQCPRQRSRVGLQQTRVSTIPVQAAQGPPRATGSRPVGPSLFPGGASAQQPWEKSPGNVEMAGQGQRSRSSVWVWDFCWSFRCTVQPTKNELVFKQARIHTL